MPEVAAVRGELIMLHVAWLPGAARVRSRATSAARPRAATAALKTTASSAAATALETATAKATTASAAAKAAAATLGERLDGCQRDCQDQADYQCGLHVRGDSIHRGRIFERPAGKPKGGTPTALNARDTLGDSIPANAQDGDAHCSPTRNIGSMRVLGRATGFF